MFLSSIMFSILIGRLRGGRIAGFAEVEFKKVGWILLSFAVRFGLSWATGRLAIPAAVAAALHMSAYVMIVYAVARNTRLKGMWLIGLGTALNLVVIAANSGRMPIGPEGLKRAGLDVLPSFEAIRQGVSYTHELVTGATRLAFLGDVLYIPKPLWPPTVFSVGDILVMLGAFILVQFVMIPRRPARSAA
ncbi:MAG: DUF5317 domain-containing protein [Firmicutes bacterium]|nr:DUF5317 domain-containing protein [Bacillota bacterium]